MLYPSTRRRLWEINIQGRSEMIPLLLNKVQKTVNLQLLLPLLWLSSVVDQGSCPQGYWPLRNKSFSHILLHHDSWPCPKERKELGIWNLE